MSEKETNPRGHEDGQSKSSNLSTKAPLFLAMPLPRLVDLLPHQPRCPGYAIVSNTMCSFFSPTSQLAAQDKKTSV